jgi:Xaa-Pro aminopeptidase
MEKEGLDFFLANSTDEYLNEYNPLEQNSRYHLCGFTGSTGEILVSAKNAYLFVDGRYHKQADEEVDKKFITVAKLNLGQSQRDGVVEILKKKSLEGQKIGIVTSKTGLNFYKKLKEETKDLSLEFIFYQKDPVSEFVNNLKEYFIRAVPLSIAGVSTEEKLTKLAEKIEETDIFVITSIEEIAYLTNLRSNQTLFSSSFKAKAIFDKKKLFVFCDTDFVNEQIKAFTGQNVIFLSEKYFENFVLNNYKDKNITIGMNFSLTNLETYLCMEKTGNKIIEIEENPVALMKSVKNQQEIDHLMECFEKSDRVVKKTIKFLNEKLEKEEQISEKALSDKVKEFFVLEKAYGLSFEVLLSSGKNTAVVHYTHPNPQKYIKKGDFVLLDCGGYYEGGYATDITRTFLAGQAEKTDNLQKKVYTIVLKAFLNAYNMEITGITTGFDIDKKARDIIEANKIKGFSFSHGTGHGVGIGVHEYPPSISPSELSKKPIATGMCFTIEPGIYNDNWGGVRLENTVVLIKEKWNLKLKTLSKVPFDEKLVDFDMLNELEKEWFFDFQKEDLF